MDLSSSGLEQCFDGLFRKRCAIDIPQVYGED